MQTSDDIEDYEPSALGNWWASRKRITPKRITFADSLNVRIGLVLYGILIPILCHFMTFNRAPNAARWQSDEWTDKLSFVLSVKSGWPVFPFLIFAMICLGMVIYYGTDAFLKTWVRLGIFSGVFVCGWYLFAFSTTVLKSPLASLGLLLGAVIWLVVVHGCIWLMIFLVKKYKWAPAIIIVGFVVISFFTAVATEGQGLIALFFAPFLLSLILSTPLAFLAYLGVSIDILVRHIPARRFTLAQLMVWVTWLTAFATALRKTISLSFAEYSRLPLEPPEGCYVATAASKGYPAIVGSQSLPTETEQPAIINQQLAIFKATELTLRVISPAAHRWFRYFYNRLGPPAAKKLSGPLSATVAYLCLKPAEWLCRFVLRVLLGRSTFRLAKNLYLLRAKASAGLANVQES